MKSRFSIYYEISLISESLPHSISAFVEKDMLANVQVGDVIILTGVFLSGPLIGDTGIQKE